MVVTALSLDRRSCEADRDASPCEAGHQSVARAGAEAGADVETRSDRDHHHAAEHHRRARHDQLGFGEQREHEVDDDADLDRAVEHGSSRLDPQLEEPTLLLERLLGRGDEVRRCLYTNYCEGLDQKHKEVTCQLWDRDFDADDARTVPRSIDGKRRLIPPRWTPGTGSD